MRSRRVRPQHCSITWSPTIVCRRYSHSLISGTYTNAHYYAYEYVNIDVLAANGDGQTLGNFATMKLNAASRFRFAKPVLKYFSFRYLLIIILISWWINLLWYAVLGLLERTPLAILPFLLSSLIISDML